MGIEGLSDLAGDDSAEETPQFPDAGRDRELQDIKDAELNAAREEHNRRTAGGDPR